ncbi:MAG TPA: hypothetical protein V6C58_19415 [Allocoleopsis sp.]
MTECGVKLRNIGHGAANMEEVANRIVNYFYENLINPENKQPACALIRFFKTHNYGNLPTELQQVALEILGNQAPIPTMKCLTLLATVGQADPWNKRQNSQGHQVIPLVSPDVVAKAPMISQLINQFGLEISTILAPDPQLLLSLEKQTFNVFYIPDALGSRYIPAQETFIIPFNIKSVLGFGGILPSGNLFAIILFSQVKIPQNTADLFKTLALNVKLAILPFAEKVFD